MKSLFESHMQVAAKVMDMQLERQNVVMSNIANVRTPNYQRRTLDFEDNLQDALKIGKRLPMQRTDSRHVTGQFDPDTFSSEFDKNMSLRKAHGEDRIDLDKEMALLAKTSLQYNALASVIKSNFDSLKTTITEAGK